MTSNSKTTKTYGQVKAKMKVPPTPPKARDPRMPKRSADYDKLSPREQWDEDKRHGYLDL
jgi:hypothetical protein